MIGPGWASNPDSPITVARQRVLRRYRQRHRGRPCAHDMTLYITIICCNIILQLRLLATFLGSIINSFIQDIEPLSLTTAKLTTRQLEYYIVFK